MPIATAAARITPAARTNLADHIAPAARSAPGSRSRRPARAVTAAVATPYSWQDQWYACGSVTDFGPRSTRHVRLLDEDYVVWADAQGGLRAARDRCLHAGSPLSQGRVRADGRLQCGYHAWQYAPSGHCVHNPHAAEPALCRNRSLRMLPVRAQDGVVYAWPGACTVDAEGVATPTPPTPLPETPEPFRRGIATVGVDFFAEGNFGQLLTNALDLAHTATVHRFGPPEAQRPLTRCDLTPREDGGFSARGSLEGHAVLDVTLAPPGNVYNRVAPRRGPTVHIWSQLTPRGRNAHGVAEVFHVSRIGFEGESAWQDALFRLAASPALSWWWHLQNLEIAEEDIRAVSHAALRPRDELLPTQHDVPRRAARAWFVAAAASAPAWLNADVPPVALRLDGAMDRMAHHTRGCTQCRPVYDATTRVGQVATPAALAAAAAASWGALRDDARLTGAMVALACTGAAAGALATVLRRAFERGD